MFYLSKEHQGIGMVRGQQKKEILHLCYLD